MNAKRLVRGEATMQDMRRVLDELGVRAGNVFFVSVPESNQALSRTTDPDTSREAAASVKLTKNEQAVLQVFVMIGRPLTDKELALRYATIAAGAVLPPQSPSGLRTRRSSLRDKGYVVDTKRTKLEDRRRSKIWALKED